MVTTLTRTEETTSQETIAAIAEAENIIREHARAGASASTPFAPTAGANLATGHLEVVDNLTWS